MNNLLDLQQKRAKLVADMHQLVERASKEQRGLTAEENEQFERMFADAEALRKTIEASTRLSAVRAEIEAFVEERDRAAAAGDPEALYHRAFMEYIRRGSAGLSPENRSLLEARAQSAFTGNLGGYTVPQGFYAKVVSALKAFGGVREAATILATDSGNPLPIPTNNDTGNKGRLLSENTAVTTTDLAFGQKVLGAYKYSSDQILVPIELFDDTGVDLETFIADALAVRLGRILNEHFTVGTGTNQPQGVVTGSALGKLGANGQTTSVTYDDLVDLVHSVDRAYRKNGKFMMADSTWKAVLKLKDSSGRPLVYPNTSGIGAQAAEALLGFPVIINNDVPAMSASAKSILFGDFTNYWIRDVKNPVVVRFNERYMDNGQIGFVMFSRHDGQLINAGTDPIKHYQNSAT